MIKNKNIFLWFIAVTVSLVSCSKEPIKSLSFSEKMIGKWEMRETVNVLEFQDREWHVLTPPYVSMNLDKDNNYFFLRDCIDTIEAGSYNISEEDSIVYITTLFTRPLDLKRVELTDSSFLLTFNTDEGEQKEKYFKVE